MPEYLARPRPCGVERGFHSGGGCDKVRLNVLQSTTVCATVCDMAETKSRSIRVADDVWEAIQGLPGKTDDALRAVLVSKKPVVDEHADINRWFRETWQRLEEILEMLQSEPSEYGPPVFPTPAREIPGVQVGIGAAKSAAGQFPCQCRHSGCRGGKFMGTGRGLTLCPECFATGHRGEPRNCGPCFEDTGPA